MRRPSRLAGRRTASFVIKLSTPESKRRLPKRPTLKTTTLKNDDSEKSAAHDRRSSTHRARTVRRTTDGSESLLAQVRIAIVRSGQRGVIGRARPAGEGLFVRDADRRRKKIICYQLPLARPAKARDRVSPLIAAD